VVVVIGLRRRIERDELGGLDQGLDLELVALDARVLAIGDQRVGVAAPVAGLGEAHRVQPTKGNGVGAAPAPAEEPVALMLAGDVGL